MRRPVGLPAVVAVLAVLVTAWLPIASAHAHGDLLGTRTPAAGEVLQVFPREVRLQFTARLSPVDPLVEVRDARGRSVTAGPPVVDVLAVAQPLTAEGSDGTYTVTWQVVAEDGHPASGTYVFAVGDPAEVTVPATGPATAAPSPSVAPAAGTPGGTRDPGAIAGVAAAALLSLALLTVLL